MLLLLCSALCYEPPIVPYPNSITDKQGTWTLSSSAQIGYAAESEDAKKVATFAATQLRKSTGYALPIVSGSVTDGIFFDFAESLDNEEYVLDMDSRVVHITGSKYAGLFWGYQTLLQLLPAEATLEVVQSLNWTARTVHVEDKPAYQYRGVMADPSRHWLNVTEIKTIIDNMARFKLNHFHFHFADDQGWRLESKRFPLLTQIGSIRSSSPQRWDPSKQDNVPYGPYFYTMEEVKGIVAYAKERSIEVVPEIEMPGHGQALLAAYPQYSCTQKNLSVRTTWGVNEDLYCAGSDETIQFLEDLLNEALDVFEDCKYFHLGGDESPKGRWNACPKCQQRIKDENLKDANDLQFWLLDRFAKILEQRGKVAIEWDDYVNALGKIPENTHVMAWLTDGSKVTNLDRYVIQARSTILYFPQKQFNAFDGYEYPSFSSLHSLKLAYQYNPRGSIAAAKQHFVLGAECPIWGEYIWNGTEYDWKLFPRGMAVAEMTWTNLDRKSWPRFLSILARRRVADLRKVGVNTAPLTITPAGEWHSGEIPSDHWVDVQWPVKGNFGQGKIEAAFIWKDGANGLRVRNVRFVVDGKVISTVARESLAYDSTTADNIYSFDAPNVDNAKSVVIIAEVKAEGGTNSIGSMYCYPVN